MRRGAVATYLKAIAKQANDLASAWEEVLNVLAMNPDPESGLMKSLVPKLQLRGASNNAQYSKISHFYRDISVSLGEHRVKLGWDWLEDVNEHLADLIEQRNLAVEELDRIVADFKDLGDGYLLLSKEGSLRLETLSGFVNLLQSEAAALVVLAERASAVR